MPHSDEFWMQKALDFAWQGWRESRPNPCVGALAVKNGELLGMARSAPHAGPHAEAQLVRELKDQLQGADLYVTLEPCSHFGRNPPCAPAVLGAGVRRVFVACLDPNPEVSGRGIQLLRDAGVEVITGVAQEMALRSLQGFFHWISKGQPEIWLKAALDMDGTMADVQGPLPITGGTSALWTQNLRSQVDAVLVGGQTLRLDQPRLNVRTPGYASGQPIPVVWTRQKALELPLDSLLALHPSVWVVGPDVGEGNDRIRTLPTDQHGDPHLALVQALGRAGLHRVLVESGPQSLQGWLNSGLVSRYYEARALEARHFGLKTQVQIPKELELKSFARLDNDLWSEFGLV